MLLPSIGEFCLFYSTKPTLKEGVEVKIKQEQRGQTLVGMRKAFRLVKIYQQKR